MCKWQGIKQHKVQRKVNVKFEIRISRARQIYSQNDPIYSFSFYNQQTFISVINQLDAQHFCFTISLFHASAGFEHMCSKRAEAWNKLIVKQKCCASSCLITEINILRCTVSRTSKSANICVISFAVSGYRKCLCCNLINITLWVFTITSTNTGSDTNIISDYCSRAVRTSGFVTVCLWMNTF